MEQFPTLKGRDHDLGSGHIAYHHASLIDPYMLNFIKIKVTFCGRTDVHTDGRSLRPTLLG